MMYDVILLLLKCNTRTIVQHTPTQLCMDSKIPFLVYMTHNKSDFAPVLQYDLHVHMAETQISCRTSVQSDQSLIRVWSAVRI